MWPVQKFYLFQKFDEVNTILQERLLIDITCFGFRLRHAWDDNWPSCLYPISCMDIYAFMSV